MNVQLLVAALVAATGTAAAAGPLDPPAGAADGRAPAKVMVIVSSHGLDLTSDAGADQFLGRLTAAVNRACDDRPSDGPALTLTRSAGFRACASQALGTAMSYVRSPVVKQRYAAMQAKDGLVLARR
jgi:UrcA family protein